MRHVWYAVVLVALCSRLVVGQTRAPSRPNAAQQTELDRLDREVSDQQAKRATFAAAKSARKRYDLIRKIYGDTAPETLRKQLDLGLLLQQNGDYGGAIALFQANLAAIEKTKGVDSREALVPLNYLVGLYLVQGRYEELDPYQQRLLALTKKLDGEQSQTYATALQSYGGVLQMRNELAAATRVFEELLALREKLTAGKDDYTVMSALQLLANAYWTAGQQQKAIVLFDRAIATVTAMKDAQPQTVAGTLWGIAAQYQYGGRPDLAAPLRKRVIELFTKEIARLEQTKPDDYSLPSLIGQLAFQYREEGDLVNAEKQFERAMAIEAKRGTPSAWNASLADLKRATGRPKEALKLLEQAKASLAQYAPANATAFDGQIADVLREAGDYARSEQLLTSYLASVEKTYGKRHPLYGISQLGLARLYMASKRPADAERVLTSSLEAAERDVALALSTGTESDHALYFARNNYLLDLAINFQLVHAPKSATATRLALTTLLRRKGRVLDAAASNLKTIRAKLAPEDKKLLDDLATARSQLARLTVAGPDATGPDSFAKEVATLEDQIQKLEIAVGNKSAAYRAVTQTIDLASVQKLIPADARLVEIVNFTAADPIAPYRLPYTIPPRHYAAFVVGRTGDPTLVDLGAATAIDEAIEKFRKAVSDPKNKQVFALGNDLYKLTLAKLRAAIGTSTHILLAPDGALNVVPFSALVDDQQQLLIQKYTFTYLTSGRDLLRLKLKSKAQGGGVMFADPSFDTSAPSAAPGATSRGRRSSDLASLLWPPLPGTAAEADEIEKHMRGLTVFRGSNATEGALKRVHGPKILHLATHGFFLPDEHPVDAADGGRAAPVPTFGVAPPSSTAENPLLRSGLALAGANKLASGDDDGILTAMEATGLDLWGTKLVVLSACETGVGKVTNGDGVYGLRRALVIAGAESLVMSLWQVDDLATKELMAGYYTKLQTGASRSSALRDVQLELAANKKFAHPYYWAAFLPAGDESPLGK